MSVSSAVGRLANAFRTRDVGAAGFVETLVAELRDVPPDLLDRAVTVLIRTKTDAWMPTVGEIRAACAELATGLPTEQQAVEQVEARIAWARDGANGTPPPVAPAVADALRRAGGYAAFRTGDSGIVKAQFGRAYREIRADAIRTAQLTPALPPGAAARELDR